MVAHAIVAVGASGGGLEPLRRITERLPRNCAVTVFVVMHSGAASFLPEILSWHGKLRVEFAREGDFIAAGRIYVAPPDHHMCVEAGHIRLNKGARVHSVRPAIDPMFASIAGAYGRRVMGVVLSGAGTDGAAGIVEIERLGGCALVQDPRQASSPSMPKAALAADSPECLSIEDIAVRVTEFCLHPSAAQRLDS
ncbi:MAG: two-component system, chemotaxis family, protein-glutamate methylesterase/glutaminase [Rhodospirillaceae bacterium]|jgi:two-component system chemotaxis response regulator CheB|nr:two-component system, chemotaxis family, protein-glutamate methylesterase/glutaminase [Rhodospirillaceae bacterium]MEA2849966.1 two-component system, chemotaxis family, protein-glutamate methylesterase/glutaminase [Rhodospirillaceae bacterium]